MARLALSVQILSGGTDDCASELDDSDEEPVEPGSDPAAPDPAPAPADESLTDAASGLVAQSYFQKLVLFAIILALVAWFIRRRRSGNKIDEKSLA